jgi:hypothetical protein
MRKGLKQMCRILCNQRRRLAHPFLAAVYSEFVYGNELVQTSIMWKFARDNLASITFPCRHPVGFLCILGFGKDSREKRYRKVGIFLPCRTRALVWLTCRYRDVYMSSLVLMSSLELTKGPRKAEFKVSLVVEFRRIESYQTAPR